MILEDLETRDVAPPIRSPQRTRHHLIEWIVVLVAALVVRSCVFEVFRVPSGSMLPTLQINDRIVVDKLPGLARAIHRGDVIVFHEVSADRDNSTPILVKRVIGLPGETISSRGDHLYIDGRVTSEPWLAGMKSAGCWEPAFRIPTTYISANQYYVLGDCRSDSYDSRYWGTVPIGNVVGRVSLVIWRHNHPWIHWF